MEIYLDDLKPEVAEDILSNFGFSVEQMKKLLNTPNDIQIGYLEAEAFEELRNQF